MSLAGRAIIIISLAAALGIIPGTVVAKDLSHPIAAFTYNPCVMCAAPGDIVFFDGNYSTTIIGTIVSYTWNFGDGTSVLTTTSPFTTHMYGGMPGRWQVTLMVQDSNGQIDTVSQLVIFNVAPRFTIQPANPETGQFVTFNASSTTIYFQPSQPKFLWSFGDGSQNATGAVVVHVYSTAGVYRVSLSVATPDGNATISKTIIVSPDPPSGGGGGKASVEL